MPLYVHRLSNHPPSVIKNIPEGVNKRLSSISSNEEMFESVAPIYREALAKSGYDFQLKFDPHASEPSKKKNKNRHRDAIWFNPPYSAAIRSNVGKDFLNLVTRSFPPGHPLRKIFNRNTVKISYSGTPSIERIISSTNKKILQPPKPEERLCSCPKTKICPLDGKCLSKNVIYEATVTQQNNKTNRYTGICSTDFKARLAAHKHTIKDGSQNQTSYSKFVRNLEQKKIKHTVTWRILARGGIYSPMTEKCSLCIKENFVIMFRPESADINSKDEIFSACRHKKMKLLIPKERKKRNKGPG